jgi:hypothetical protein
MINDKTINVGIRLTGRTATLDAIYVALRAWSQVGTAVWAWWG